jgi:hypothetical protein
MESDPLSKIEAVLQTLDLVERKSEVYKTAVLSHVDELEAELAKARTQLQEAPTPEQRAAVLGVLTEAIRVKKPLTSIEQRNKDFYKYISKLGRKVEGLRDGPEENLELYHASFDHKALKEAIAEFILYFSAKLGQQTPQEVDLNQVCAELGVVFPERLAQRLEKLQALKEIEVDIEARRLQRVWEWVGKHLEELVRINSRLPFLVSKLWVLGPYFNRQVDFPGLVASIREHMGPFYSQNRRDIDCLLTAVCVTRFQGTPSSSPVDQFIWKHRVQFSPTTDLETTYASLLAGDDWEEIRDLFVKESERILEIPTRNPLFEVFRAGVLTYPQFIQFADCFRKDDTREDTVGVSLALPEDFNHHSLIVCPVSKEVCTPDNPPVMLTCGHVISDASAKKLGQAFNDFGAAKKFKCPVCPEEQLYSKVRVIKMD